jgi:hypothetical protein
MVRVIILTAKGSEMALETGIIIQLEGMADKFDNIDGSFLSRKM